MQKKTHKKNHQKNPQLSKSTSTILQIKFWNKYFFGVNIAVCEHVVYILIGRIKNPQINTNIDYN